MAWLSLRANLGLADRTIAAYAGGLSEYLDFCTACHVDPLRADPSQIARFVHHLMNRAPANLSSTTYSSRLANATVQQRLTVIRLFYDYLVEEDLRATNPVGRGRPGQRRGLLPRFKRLPWIPNEAEWSSILTVARREPIRNRTMLALAYDAGLRREELCSLGIRDIDPATRTLRIRAETTKSRRERVVPYSSATGELLNAYLAHRNTLSRARGTLFLSESRRNYAQPLTLWTWSKVIRRLALAADVPQFTTHTLRHLCLTDLARAGWELHLIATFAGHRSLVTTMLYIHVSGRELTEKYERSMRHLHAWRAAALLSGASVAKE
jgi:integrase/recombinase XerD